MSQYDGQLVLAQVDIDANPAIAQALQAQAVPLVVGLVKGQPVPLFQGTVEEAEARRYFDELVNVAAQNGVTGPAQPAGEAPEAPRKPRSPRTRGSPPPTRHSPRATSTPRSPSTRSCRRSTRRTARSPSGWPASSCSPVRRASTCRPPARLPRTRPDDLEAQMLVADLDVSGGHVDDAFDRLIQLVKRTSGDDRERVRERLLELFTVVGIADPRVAAARRALASALF